MSRLELQMNVLGGVMTNVYYAMNTETKELFIVDPAAAADRIAMKIEEMQGTPKAILLTHGHFDHILAVEKIRERFQIPVYACRMEEEMLREPSLNLTDQIKKEVSLSADRWLDDLEVFDCAGFSVQILHTPGHTPGSCCYYLKDENVLFSGDTLFCGSAGRTDLPGGSMPQLQKSLRRLVDSLPGETRVFPGHDSGTTIEREKRYNPFV